MLLLTPLTVAPRPTVGTSTGIVVQPVHTNTPALTWVGRALIDV